MKGDRTYPLIVSGACGSLGLGAWLALSIGILSEGGALLALTAILLAYLCAQVMYLRKAQPLRWLINPVVVCSGMVFFMGYGLSNFLYFLPEETLEYHDIASGVTPAMVKLMVMVLLGAVGMWTGYWSNWASALVTVRQQSRFAHFLQKSNQIRIEVIVLLLFASAVSRLVSISLGVYGYSSNYDRLIELGAFTQYLALLGSLGKLVLVVSALDFYSKNEKWSSSKIFYVALGLEVAFGVLSGFKGAIVMPFAIVGFCQYVATGKVSKKWIIVLVFGIFLAYQIVEPFRDSRNSSSNFRGTSAIEIMDVMINASGGSSQKTMGTEDNSVLDTVIEIFARSSMTQIGSLGIDFSDASPDLPSGSPQFLENIFLAPLHAVVPRLIWSSKPESTLGLWYTQEVIGNIGMLSATAMGVVTYLYFAGGAIAIFLGLFFVGILQRVMFFLLRPTSNLGGALVFIGMLQTIAVLGDSFNDIIIDLFRVLPMLIILQRIVYKKNTKSQAVRTVESTRCAG